ncbi:MerR family transcriptional regulator [Cohnella pontilimi]|uniref:MerR family transcriptional regulator n=1 Tax=Cohnella pontilimi TaxID=2564100 RepID=A0A4U0FGZ0_9BACL|nr:MerR family transcriptional regulator [Cohnella pontilimi]TJY44178.1 MerR family transcriptional regulator [Cohnella pontilimi]
MALQVKEVAELAGVSVRTLHHYDEIGLLVPFSVTPAGYRLYSGADLERLQQILFFKELGFSLKEIKEILDSPGFDRRKALTAHRELLLEKRERMDRMLETVNRTLQSIEGGTQMADKELFEGFDMDKIQEHQAKYSEEARRLYGKEIVEAAERKVEGYSEEKWKEMHGVMGGIYNRLADRMAYGPSDSEAQQAVAEWRQYITDHFYDCTLEIFRGLGSLYVDDERFTANIDKYKPGLAQFMKEAMHLYCDRMEAANQA